MIRFFRYLDRRGLFLFALGARLIGTGVASVNDEGGLIWWIPSAQLDAAAWIIAGLICSSQAFRRDDPVWVWWLACLPPLARVIGVIMDAPNETWNDTLGATMANLSLVAFILIMAGVPRMTPPPTPPGGIPKVVS